MGSCTRRHFLLSTCFLQMITVVERQVFDFLGYMWAPIIVNFFHIIFIIFGFFGAYHLRAKYIIAYLIWNFIWIGWNVFLICFYLDVGVLDKDSDILNLGTGSVSWFEVNGYGCVPTYPTNITTEDLTRPVRPEQVDNCFVDYPIVEVIHSGIQCILAVLAILGAILIALIFFDEDDRLRKVDKKGKHQSFYSIEFGPAADTIRGRPDNLMDYQHGGDVGNDKDAQMSPKPMTPRRVKRRSVMTRGSNGRQSTQSRRSHSSNRNSARHSRRKFQQNPVTKLMEQQQQQLHQQQKPKQFASFSHIENPTLTATNLKSLNNDIIANSSNKSDYKSFKRNIQPDPIYYNTSVSTLQLQETWNSGGTAVQASTTGVASGVAAAGGGHYNPTYQHSTPNLNYDGEHVDELYNNRPPSVRSSYSNFHGTRPISTYQQITENVFAEITNGQQQPQQAIAAAATTSYVQAVPQAELTRRSASRESIRSMAFLNSGPPAYNLNYHTPPDSETTM